MKALMALGFSTVLAVVLAGPSLLGADREQTRGSEFADFSQLKVERGHRTQAEARRGKDLPLGHRGQAAPAGRRFLIR